MGKGLRTQSSRHGRRRWPRTRRAELMILCARIGFTPPG
jgi:hypothetical protein